MSVDALLSKSYRTFLRKVLQEKKAKNPSFSIRAFSLHLGMSQSSLGLVFQGRKNLSPEMALKIAKKLGLSTLQRQYFLTLVQLETTREPELKAELRRQLRAMRPYPGQRETLPSVTDLSLVICALTEVPDFDLSVEYLAPRLRASKEEIQRHIDHLTKEGILARDAEGRWQQVGGRLIHIGGPGDQKLLDRFLNHYRLAMASITEQPKNERLHLHEIFSFTPALLAQAEELAEEFTARLLSLKAESQEEGVATTDAYCAMVTLFNLTPKKK